MSVSQAVSGQITAHKKKKSIFCIHFPLLYFRISPVSKSMQLQQGIHLQRGGELRMRVFDRISEWSERGNNWHSWRGFESDFLKRLTKASPPVGAVASSSTPRLYSKSVRQVRQKDSGTWAAFLSK